MTASRLDPAGLALADRLRRRVVGLAPGDAVTARLLTDWAREEAPLASRADVDAAVQAVLAVAVGLGPLEPLLADPAVNEVMVNGPGPVWVERAGRIERTDVVVDGSAIAQLVERIVAPLGLRADRASPCADARLPDGSRAHVVMPPLAVDGPYLTIRRFAARPMSVDDFCPPQVAALLRAAVAERRNLLVAGATSSGKTTLLNALAAEIPECQRVVTVEEAAELRLGQEHVVRLEARPPNAEGAGEFRVRDLVRNALRMRPDRLVVGEARGAEAFDLLQAMNTGHDGSFSTLHANSPADALRRLESMTLLADVGLPLAAVRQQIAAAVDVVVQVARRPGGRRAVVEVAEVGARPPDVCVVADERVVHRQFARPPRCDP
ncbi:MAG: pilus assembly protein CpaF [Acidimicrobiaceae bacterium]|jgi:pilus assembly protein CpaF|nr:pilus assembly protein CpaF [Acidimicrobiaceae bacterium]